MTDEGAPFAALLRAGRRSAGLSQQDLAERSGLSVRAISNLERGLTRWPPPDSVARLANALQLRDRRRAQFLATADRRPHRSAAAGEGLAAPVRLGHAAPPGADGGPVVPRRLPASVRHFTGRGSELKQMTDLLEAESDGMAVVAIDGTAGVGKTALALHWAHRVAGRFPDGQIYADLRGFDPAGRPVRPTEAVCGFLDAFGVPAARVPADPDAQTGLYRSLLAGRRVLVVLDNAHSAEQVRPLLPGGPGCLVVVTSRSPLPSLAVTEEAALLALDVLSRGEARDLLDARLPAARTRAEPEAADALADLCAGLPLALSITAARAAARPGLPLAALVAELRDARGRLDALAVGDETADLRAVFSWSLRSLSAPGARMFRMLGLHAGPDASASAAAALAGVPARQARKQLDELTRANLLTEPAPGRLGFHDLLRAYAAEQAQELESDAERHAALLRAFDFYLHSAYAAALLLNLVRTPLALQPPAPGVRPDHFADPEQARAWFRAEHRVLLAVVALAAETGFDTHVGQLTASLTAFLNRLGSWDDWHQVARIALECARRLGDRAAEADAQRSLGRIAVRWKDTEGARDRLLQALDLYRQVEDRSGQADVHLAIGRMLARGQCYAEALDHAGRALALYRDGGDPVGPPYALNAMGWYQCCLGRHDTALRYCREALELHRKSGDIAGLADVLDSIGYAHWHLGQTADAVAAYEEAARLYQQIGARYDLAATLDRTGDARAGTGDTAGAAQDWRRALAIFDELGHQDADPTRAKLARGFA